MADNLSMMFPRFKKFNAFFADLKGDFEPTILTEKEKEASLKAVASIDGVSTMDFWSLREDLELTAAVREARRYANGTIFVRFEFKRLEETGASCASTEDSYGFTWSRPYHLMAAFDPMWTFESYTVLPGRDVVAEGLEFSVSSSKSGSLRYEDTDDVAYVLDRLTNGSRWREVIVYDKASHGHIANINGFGGGNGFEMYWNLCCLPWNVGASRMTPSQVEACLNALVSGGIKALEDAFDWNATADKDATVRVDEMLRRSLELAKRRGDEIGARTVRAVGVDENAIDNPFRFLDIRSGTLGEMKRQIFNIACDEKDKVRSSKLFAMLALRGHMQSRCNLGYHFHFGMGVPVDYDLAVYWHTLAAEAGDACAMVNLGKIFSEKDGPKWDGPKAVEWFEKAVAKGDTWAMGELAHCLLCGECAGKDETRAQALLEKAVAANPDREDFAEDLKKLKHEIS